MAVPDSTAELASFLKKHKVAEALATFMMQTAEEGGLGMESISDFASAFPQERHQELIQSHIGDKVPAFKDNIVAVGRVRTAWLLAKAELEKAARAVVTGTADTDWDAPLDETEETARSEAWNKAYDNLAFDTESTPYQCMIARHYREFRAPTRNLTIWPLKRSKTQAEYGAPIPSKRQRLTETTDLIERNPALVKDKKFWRVGVLAHAMRVLCNCLAMTGTALVESKSEWDEAKKEWKKVREVHLTQAISYADFFARKALEHPDNEQAVIAWLLDRDGQTRAKALQIYKAGSPYGEALLHARDVDCAVLWTCGATGVARMQRAVTDDLGDAMDEDYEEEEAAYAQPPMSLRQRKRFRQRASRGARRNAQGQQHQSQARQQQQLPAKGASKGNGGRGNGGKGKSGKQAKR